MRLRVDQKLFLTYLIVIAMVVVALTLGVGALLRRNLTGLMATDVQRELVLATSLYDTRRAAPPDDVADWLGALSGRRVTLIGPDGGVLGDSELPADSARQLENHASRPEVRTALAGGVGRAVRMSTSVRIDHLYLARRTPDGRVLRLAVPLHEVRRMVVRVQRGIFSVGMLALALTGVLSFGFSRAVTHRLRRMAGVARAMAGGDLALRARGGEQDELGAMADALDTLASELQRRLRQLEGERAEMQVLIDAMAEAVIAVDADGRVQRANPAAQRIFSLPPDPRGLLPREVARRQDFADLVKHALRGQSMPPRELTHDGRHLLATAQPLPSGGSVMVFLDVSELRRLEDVRRDFVANASHELKTPLTAIRGYAETLLDPDLPPELRGQFTQTVKANADRLQRIVEDLLDLSRIESGGWRVEPEIVSINELAAEAWAGVQQGARIKAARFAAQVPDDCEFVWADSSALRQVFSNLFGNSLRYIPEGGSVELHARCGEADRKWIEVSVRDDGSGIPSTHLPRIFERFYRADTARSRAEGGTGLGLSIVRHLVEAHGGRVEAESELGRGTTIRFTLPAPDEADGPGPETGDFEDES